jgi:hypothetical protein
MNFAQTKTSGSHQVGSEHLEVLYNYDISLTVNAFEAGLSQF